MDSVHDGVVVDLAQYFNFIGLHKSFGVDCFRPGLIGLVIGLTKLLYILDLVSVRICLFLQITSFKHPDILLAISVCVLISSYNIPLLVILTPRYFMLITCWIITAFTCSLNLGGFLDITIDFILLAAIFKLSPGVAVLNWKISLWRGRLHYQRVLSHRPHIFILVSPILYEIVKYGIIFAHITEVNVTRLIRYHWLNLMWIVFWKEVILEALFQSFLRN